MDEAEEVEELGPSEEEEKVVYFRAGVEADYDADAAAAADPNDVNAKPVDHAEQKRDRRKKVEDCR